MCWVVFNSTNVTVSIYVFHFFIPTIHDAPESFLGHNLTSELKELRHLHDSVDQDHVNLFITFSVHFHASKHFKNSSQTNCIYGNFFCGEWEAGTKQTKGNKTNTSWKETKQTRITRQNKQISLFCRVLLVCFVVFCCFVTWSWDTSISIIWISRCPSWNPMKQTDNRLCHTRREPK